MKRITYILTAASLFAASNVAASPVLYTPLASTAAGANLISATLTAQNDLLTKHYNTKEAAASAAASATTSTSQTASTITSEVENNIATTISQTITNASGTSPASGSFSLGDGTYITYIRGATSTSVTIQQVGQQTINLSFPNI